jgi:hypothetical protein
VDRRVPAVAAEGLETDLGLIRRLGRATAIVAAGGLLIPVLAGVNLGFLVPEAFVGDAAPRAFRRILVPAAGTRSGRAAQELADRLAAALGAEVRIAHVLTLPSPAQEFAYSPPAAAGAGAAARKPPSGTPLPRVRKRRSIEPRRSCARAASALRERCDFERLQIVGITQRRGTRFAADSPRIRVARPGNAVQKESRAMRQSRTWMLVAIAAAGLAAVQAFAQGAVRIPPPRGSGNGGGNVAKGKPVVTAEQLAALGALGTTDGTLAGPGTMRQQPGDDHANVYRVISGAAPDACVTVLNIGSAPVLIVVPGEPVTGSAIPGATIARCFAAPAEINLRCDEDHVCDVIWRVDAAS